MCTRKKSYFLQQCHSASFENICANKSFSKCMIIYDQSIIGYQKKNKDYKAWKTGVRLLRVKIFELNITS